MHSGTAGRRPPGARLRRCDGLVVRMNESASYPRCKRRWRMPWSGNSGLSDPSLPRRPLVAGRDRAREQEASRRTMEEGSLK
jgi:hypothetical protein